MFSKLLLAFDGTREGRQALREAAALARRIDAKVHLLSVVRLTPGELLADSALPGGLVEYDQGEMDKIVREGLAELRQAGVTAEGTLSRGPDPARDIADLARRIGADLIVLGHRDQGVLARLWNGSVGQQLVAQAPCSILIAVAPAEKRRWPSAAA